jgi:hypothetical protein
LGAGLGDVMNDSFMSSDAMKGSFTASRPARSGGGGTS